jgi:exopolysaccharide biosynthesis WecB/TagA/CpsF family protein
MNHGRRNILGVLIDAVDYEHAIERILANARARRPLKVSFLATHGVAVATENPEYRARLNAFDLNLPDGQPVRWALAYHGVFLGDRVCGPDLVQRLLERGRTEGLRVYLYGSTPQAQELIRKTVQLHFPGITIAGGRSSLFRPATAEERQDFLADIRACRPDVVLVGLGCPLQESWVFENGNEIDVPCLAVGAAFSFLAGTLSRPHPFFRQIGLEWLYRWIQEPRRLFYRYFYYGGRFVVLALLQAIRVRRFPILTAEPTAKPKSTGWSA